ncbi:MAG: thioredoxin domain-containing protein [Bacilli bacterium]|nr:thioredoxin domain-containing protein [Bacilli bacterium]
MELELLRGQSNIEEIIKNGSVVLDFFGTHCGACNLIVPFLEQLQEEYETKIKIVKINTDFDLEYAKSLDVKSLPSLLFFKDGKLVSHITGYRPKENIKREIEKIV